MQINEAPPAPPAPPAPSARGQKIPEPMQAALDSIASVFDSIQLNRADQPGGSAASVIQGLLSWLGPAAPYPGEPAEAAWGGLGDSSAGLRAKEFGRDGQSRNPATGNSDWYMSCLGWTNQAFKSQGINIPELQAPDAKTAFQRARDNGKIHYGNPPPGAIVFHPEMSQWGHVGIVNEDGTSYRGTVPRSESPTTIGDRPIPKRSEVAWMDPG